MSNSEVIADADHESSDRDAARFADVGNQLFDEVSEVIVIDRRVVAAGIFDQFIEGVDRDFVDVHALILPPRPPRVKEGGEG